VTRAQEKLAALAEWFMECSEPIPPPLHGTVTRGSHAVFVPQRLELPPNDGGLSREHLPVFIPDSQAVASLPTMPTTGSCTPTRSFPRVAADRATDPDGQGRAADRLHHIVWRFQNGDEPRCKGALIPLTNPAEPLRAALDRAFPGLDLAQHPALFLPMWKLELDPTRPHHLPAQPDYRQVVARVLPLLRG
jgi:hypothetical protein